MCISTKINCKPEKHVETINAYNILQLWGTIKTDVFAQTMNTITIMFVTIGCYNMKGSSAFSSHQHSIMNSVLSHELCILTRIARCPRDTQWFDILKLTCTVFYRVALQYQQVMALVILIFSVARYPYLGGTKQLRSLDYSHNHTLNWFLWLTKSNAQLIYLLRYNIHSQYILHNILKPRTN